MPREPFENMKHYGRFLHEGAPKHAEIEGDTAHFIANLFTDRSRTGVSAPWRSLTLLTPVEPRKLFAIGLNYADHAAESGKPLPPEPLVWLKSPGAAIAHNETIEIAFPEHRTDFEGELVIVIGRQARRLTVDEATSAILGYTCGQDISDRVVQKSESQWTRSKSMDTYAPIGPFITVGPTPENWPVQTLVNGEVRQNSSTNHLIFSTAAIVSFLSQTMTLEPGDLIFTGTPAGVGMARGVFLKPGDVVTSRIQGLGSMRNELVAKP